MLPRGARIAVVSPSGIHDPAKLGRGMHVAREWGFTLVAMPNAAAKHRYLAGNDDARLADLSLAFSGAYDAVWMARGGYGAARILARVPWAELAPVPLIGFSDGTVLLNPLARLRRPALHGPVLHALADLNDDATRSQLRAVLEGADARLPGIWLQGGGAGVEGPVLGGNLCVLASQCGTPGQLRAVGGIVLLEDLGEPPYKLDRLLTQCRDSGMFDGAVAFALGTFLDATPPPDADWTVRDVLLDVLAPLGLPILAELPVGHGHRNFALPFGVPAHFEGSELVVPAPLPLASPAPRPPGVA